MGTTRRDAGADDGRPETHRDVTTGANVRTARAAKVTVAVPSVVTRRMRDEN
jgi:hypothetical protein